MFALAWLVACVVTVGATYCVRRYALRKGIVDAPGASRKVHTAPMPLLGGMGIALGIGITVGAWLLFGGSMGEFSLTDVHVTLWHIAGVLGGIVALCIGGYLDDRHDLPPYLQILAPMIAAGLVVASGVGIVHVTNPFGGVIVFDSFRIGGFAPLAALTGWIWILVVMYTTKFLDGLDGLVSGVTSIGALIVALLSIFFFVNYPTALLAAIVSGAFAGFLVWNTHPAKIFLGEGGSTMAGFLLGVLALISGAKVATLVMVLGVPLLDAAWVIMRRILVARKSPFQADRTHIHFRLLDAGFSQRQAVFFLYAVAFVFGMMALFLQSIQKLYGIVFLVIFMVLLGVFLVGRRAEGAKKGS